MIILHTFFEVNNLTKSIIGTIWASEKCVDHNSIFNWILRNLFYLFSKTWMKLCSIQISYNFLIYNSIHEFICNFRTVGKSILIVLFVSFSNFFFYEETFLFLKCVKFEVEYVNSFQSYHVKQKNSLRNQFLLFSISTHFTTSSVYYNPIVPIWPYRSSSFYLISYKRSYTISSNPK